MGGLDALARQQRTFDLDKMHVPGIVNPGICHGDADGPCGLVNLRAAAKLFRHEITVCAMAVLQRFPAAAASEPMPADAVRADTVICGLSNPLGSPGLTKAIPR